MDEFKNWAGIPEVSDTLGNGWGVRINGCDVFDSINQHGVKPFRSFDIVRGLSTREEAEQFRLEWLRKQLPDTDREAALRSENERLELLVKDFQWGASVEAQAGDEARAELAVLNEQIELLTADLAWSENDSRDQSKELAALREELASVTADRDQLKRIASAYIASDGAKDLRIVAAEQRNAALETAIRHALDDSSEDAQTGEITIMQLDYETLATLIDEPTESGASA